MPLVKAEDLEQWADTPDAPQLFPELVRRLIFATGWQRLHRVSFRAGRGVQLAGWDGVVEADEGIPFVPAGVSGWELGTNRNVKRKAQEDYRKRTEDPEGLDLDQTTFVFVTLRRWPQKAEWVQSQLQDQNRKWRDVWVHDADDLATWLEQAPAVHVWLSGLLGRRPAHVLDLETYWEGWNAAHGPPSFDKEVVTRIHRWLRAEPASLPLPADSREEAIAIFAAALYSLPEEERTSLLSRTVVVCSEQALYELADYRSYPLIFVVNFEEDATAVAYATCRGHHVLVPVGREASLRPVVARSLPGSLTPENLLEALRALYRLVEFTGKDHRDLCKKIVRSLQELTPDGSHAWVLWGPGGAGKTRTAVEVALALEKEGWLAFFVDFHPSSPGDRLQHLFIQRWPNRPILLIVDYAEQRPADDLRALVRAVREAASKRSAPLALLFLMRAHPREPAAGHVAGTLNETQIRWEDRKVPPMEDPADRQELFYKARERFRDGLAPPDAPPEVDYDPEYLPRTPLAILALAILAAHGHRVAKSENEVAVLTALWEQWEQSRWKRTLEAQGGKEPLETPEVWEEARERIERALAAATLGRPFAAPDEVAAWWKKHFPFRSWTGSGKRLKPRWLAMRLKVLFPTTGEKWCLPPISPDPLADVVLARLGVDLDRLVASILPAPEEVRADTHWPIRMVVEVLPRLGDAAVPGAPEAAQAALEATAHWLEKIVRVLPDEVARDWLQAWKEKLPRPDRTLRLRGFLADCWRAWLNRQLPPEERAWVLDRLGFALSELGRWEEALQATQEAVGIYRRLVKQNPQAFLPRLEMSLNNLGVGYSRLGRWKKAVQAHERSVKICRQLAEQYSTDFYPELALSLNNLAYALLGLSRWEEALQAAQESVEIRRQLVEQDPQAFLPGLAATLDTLGTVLSELGQQGEALQAAQESVEISRWLVKQNPQAFLPRLAWRLNTLANVLLRLGQRQEALQTYEEAVRTLLPFFRALPAAFADRMHTMVENYLHACRNAEKIPDTGLMEELRQAGLRVRPGAARGRRPTRRYEADRFR